MAPTKIKPKPIATAMIFLCGPYKGFCGRAEFDAEAGFFHGEVVGTRDVITFQGTSHGDLRTAFIESVDDYLAMCEEDGVPPERPFSGKFVGASRRKCTAAWRAWRESRTRASIN